tara:strand:- start:140 stop:301 length:162 start_codon:yes stop_codon:yes gene_type:complete
MGTFSNRIVADSRAAARKLIRLARNDNAMNDNGPDDDGSNPGAALTKGALLSA